VAELRAAGVDLEAKVAELRSTPLRKEPTHANAGLNDWLRLVDALVDEATLLEARGGTSWLAEHKTPQAVSFRQMCAQEPIGNDDVSSPHCPVESDSFHVDC
jgi:hypothetical protein